MPTAAQNAMHPTIKARRNWAAGTDRSHSGQALFAANPENSPGARINPCRSVDSWGTGMNFGLCLRVDWR